jgi:chorismate mutase
LSSDDLHILAEELIKLDTKEKDILLEQFRKEVDRIDSEIAALLVKRINLIIEVGMIKGWLGIPTYDAKREKEIEKNIEYKDDAIIDKTLKNIYERIIDESRAIQRAREK